jgi:hypothetical protein
MKSFLLFTFVILTNTSFSQISISVSGGIDPNEVSLYSENAVDGNNAYWNKGTTFGLNGEYTISSKLTITALFHYSQYHFRNFADNGLRIPEISFLSSEGKDSKLWRTSIEAKYFFSPQSQFKFYLLTGLGVLVQDLGTVTTRFSNLNESGEYVYTIDSEIQNYFVHSLGAGIRTDVISDLFIDASANYYTNYFERFQVFVGLSLGYRIL